MTKRKLKNALESGLNLPMNIQGRDIKYSAPARMGIAKIQRRLLQLWRSLRSKSVSEVTGKGTGIGDDALKNKIKVIEDSIALNKPNPTDPIDVLSKVGGAEIGVSRG